MSEISSGLVAVAWIVTSKEGFTRCFTYREPVREDFDLGEEFTPLVRRSDAEVEIERLSNLLSATEAHVEWNKLKAVIAAKDAEIERLRQFEVAFTEWLEKSDWVQEDKDGLFYGWSLGLHRADAMRKLIEQQAKQLEQITIYKNLAAEFRLSVFADMADQADEIERLKTERGESQFCAGCNDAAKTIEKQSAALKLARPFVHTATYGFVDGAKAKEALAAIDALGEAI